MYFILIRVVTTFYVHFYVSTRTLFFKLMHFQNQMVLLPCGPVLGKSSVLAELVVSSVVVAALELVEGLLLVGASGFVGALDVVKASLEGFFLVGASEVVSVLDVVKASLLNAPSVVVAPLALVENLTVLVGASGVVGAALGEVIKASLLDKPLVVVVVVEGLVRVALSVVVSVLALFEGLALVGAPGVAGAAGVVKALLLILSSSVAGALELVMVEGLLMVATLEVV